MNKFLKNIFAGSIIIVGLFSLFFSAPAWAAPDLNEAKGYLDSLGSGAGLEGEITISTGNVINTFLAAVGTIFFILTIYAGIRWMTAQGADEKITKAKDTLQAALIGLAIILMAYAITAFVTGRLSRSNMPNNQGSNPIDSSFECTSAAVGGQCQNGCLEIGKKMIGSCDDLGGINCCK